MDIELTKRFTEVKEILKYLPEEYYIKIPKQIIDYIEKHQCRDYVWNINKTKKLHEQDLDKDTIAILSFINMEYLVSDEQREYLQKLYKYNDGLDSVNKVFINEDIFSKNKYLKNNNEQLIQYEEQTIIKRTIIKIKEFLKNIIKR